MNNKDPNQLQGNIGDIDTDATERAVNMPKTTRIILEDNDNIPPTGLFLGHNGRSFILRTGIPVEVPIEVLDVLDHAIMTVPIINEQTRQPVGWRDRHKYPYKVVRDAV